MENEGPKTPGGEEEADPAANVVHFPRDWFGPPEELVPFGPRASNESPPLPVRAEDFWGEESASIHDAMAGPRAEVDPTEPMEPLAEPPPHRRARARRTPAPRVRVRRPPLRVPRPQVRLTWPRVRRRPVVVAAVVASSCLVAASIVGSLWSGRVPLAHGGRDGATLGPAVIAPAVPPITTAQTEARAESRRRAASHGRASRARRSRASASRARVSASAGGRAPSQSVVATTSSSSVGSSARGDQSSGTGGVSSATSAAPASASSGSSGGGAGGSGGHSSGPVGPGAPFGPGHLG